MLTFEDQRTRFSVDNADFEAAHTEFS